eukprot:scaffold31951_cov40-Phaeocystis_antarctica.AAC.1
MGSLGSGSEGRSHALSEPVNSHTRCLVRSAPRPGSGASGATDTDDNLSQRKDTGGGKIVPVRTPAQSAQRQRTHRRECVVRWEREGVGCVAFTRVGRDGGVHEACRQARCKPSESQGPCLSLAARGTVSSARA